MSELLASLRGGQSPTWQSHLSKVRSPRRYAPRDDTYRRFCKREFNGPAHQIPKFTVNAI